MTEAEIAELAKSADLEQTYASYPALVRAAVERGLAGAPVLNAARTATTEPAHFFVVQAESS